jgi:hypothetical protein
VLPMPELPAGGSSTDMNGSKQLELRANLGARQVVSSAPSWMIAWTAVLIGRGAASRY